MLSHYESCLHSLTQGGNIIGTASEVQDDTYVTTSEELWTIQAKCHIIWILSVLNMHTIKHV
jgi:hypothetical protein